MIVKNGYIIAVQPHDEQYNVLCDIVANKPKDHDNYHYQLRADTLEWELVELPPVPEPVEEEATSSDYEAALTELGVL